MKRLIKFFEFNAFSDLSDQELIDGILKDISSERSKNTLVNRYYDKMLHFLVKKDTGLDVDDLKQIVNDGFVRAFKKLDTYQGPNFPGWLSKVIYRVFLNFVDEQERKVKTVPISGFRKSDGSGYDFEKVDPDVEERISKKETDQIFSEFQEYLTPKEREWLDLYRAGMTHPQISKKIGMDISTSKWYKLNLMKKLKNWSEGKLKKGRK